MLGIVQRKGGNGNWYSHYGEHWRDSFKTRIKTTYDPAIEILRIYTEKRIIEKTPVSSVHCSTAYNRQDVEAKQTSTDRWLDNEVVVATYNGILGTTHFKNIYICFPLSIGEISIESCFILD